MYKLVSYHFSCFADGLVLIYMSISSGLLLLDLIHNGVDGEAKAGHAWQVTDRDVKFQCAFFPSVVRTSAALAAHCWLAQQLSAVEEPCPDLDLGEQQGLVC